MSELPKGWLSVKLGEILEFKYGRALPAANRDGGEYPVYGSNGIVGQHSSWLSPAPTIIIGRKGSVGEVRFSEKNCHPIDTAYYINEFKHLDPRFIYHLLKQLKLSELNKSTAIPGLNRKDAYKLVISLPPQAEQSRIARIIDELSPQIDSLEARLDGITSIIKRFRQSTLTAAISGQLTKDWRESNSPSISAQTLHKRLRAAHEAEGGHTRGNAAEPTEDAHDLSASDLPTEWDIAELRDICVPGRPITYGILKPGPELDEGVPYIRVADFPGNKLEIHGIKKTSPEIDLLYKRARLCAGDLLLSIRGSVGRLIKIPKELEGANITQDTARLSISPMLSTDYIYWALLAEPTQRRIKSAMRGVAVRGINIGDVRALQIPLPAPEEQIEIVRRIENAWAFADHIERRLETAKTRIMQLSQGILAKAFRGELSSGDPNDEPAALLLDRIKTQKATKSKKTRTKPAMDKDKKITPHNIIPVTEALNKAARPLTSLELLRHAGYPSDAGIELMEQFFLDIRERLFLGEIIKYRPQNSQEDCFSANKSEAEIEN